MTFAAPLWLAITGILVLALGLLLTYSLRQRESRLARFVAVRLLPELIEHASVRRMWTKAALLVFGLAAIGLALARPQYGIEWTERKARGLDIVFVLDSSKSMLATDLRPNRLERAKLAILDLVNRLESDRIGLVAFAGRAFLQTPPTLDYSAFRESLASIDPQVMTRGGSDLGSAIQEAAKAFPAQTNIKVMVLLTDGQDLGGASLQAAQAVADEGIKIYAVGIGTPEGEYLKTRADDGSERFVRDAQGQPVRSQLDETTLQQIAQLTQGSYCRLSDPSLEQLYSAVIANLPRTERESEMQEVRIERFQWALIAALVFLIAEQCLPRRKSHTHHIAGLSLCLIAAPIESPAQEPPLEAQLSNTTLIEALQENDTPATSAAPPSDPRAVYNQALHALSEGDFDRAQASFAQAVRTTSNLTLQRDALYNMGHTSYQLGEAAYQSQDFPTAIQKWSESEALFQSAEQIDPKDTAAREDAETVAARRQALEDFLKQQEEQENSEAPEDSQNSSDAQSQPSENSENSNQNQNSPNSDEASDSQEPQPDAQDESDNSQTQAQDGSEGDAGEEQPSEASADESDSNAEAEQQDSGEAPSSTEDPMADMPQPNDPDEAQAPAADTQAIPETAAANDATADTATDDASEGMRLTEAQNLLDSLRDRERLLPYTEAAPSQQRDLRDW